MTPPERRSFAFDANLIIVKKEGCEFQVKNLKKLPTKKFRESFVYILETTPDDSLHFDEIFLTLEILKKKLFISPAVFSIGNGARKDVHS